MGTRPPRVRRAPAAAAPVAIVGHIDEIGLIVTHIDDEGFLWFTGVGGWDPQILVGQRVVLATRDGAGARRDRQEADPPAQGGGAQEGRRAQGPAHRHRRHGRRRGAARWCASATSRSSPASRSSCPTAASVSRALDNRLGCFVAYEAARLVAEAGGAPGDVVAVAAVQEEIDLRRRADERLLRSSPTSAIVVDVTHATDAPGHRRARRPASTRSARAR